MAVKLGYHYIDTGAMYRAVTLFFLEEEIDIADHHTVDEALGRVNLVLDGLSVKLNQKVVDKEIRMGSVNELVSKVSAISSVRAKMVAYQQELGINRGVVMDGRDIGTVVFPDAELKLFMTADIEVRVDRRMKELTAKGMEQEREVIRRNLLERDRIDSTRKDSPLRKAEDAIEIDTTNLTLDGQIDMIVEMAKKIIDES